MKIAILGFGIEGKSAYEYFSKSHPDYEIVVFDEKKVASSEVDITQVKSLFGIDFSSFDIILRSPSVSPVKLKKVLPNGAQLTSATGVFFDKCPAKIIGITGTKGKGTTASFVTEILKSAGKTVHLVGNIGVPALDILPEVKKDDVVVYELSSFQLWDLEKSPHIAVLTILEPDHLEVHENYQEYVDAKFNIIKYQNPDDFFIYNSENFDSKTQGIVKDLIKNTGAKAVDVSLWREPKGLKNVIEKNVQLPGEHNIQNADLAVLAVKAFDVGVSDEEIASGLRNFTGLPHRLKFVAEKADVKYYDDSIATTPGSAIAAIKSFKNPKILILGGFDKGADYSVIAEPANEYDVKEIFVIGSNRAKVASQIGKKFNGKITQLESQNIDEIVKTIASEAEKGDVVIMSPAAASFDIFKNYQDRGEQFVDAVNKLP